MPKQLLWTVGQDKHHGKWREEELIIYGYDTRQTQQD